jgi:Ni/Fe-hydrogenase 1 B-type cytochrome subunit
MSDTSGLQYYSVWDRTTRIFHWFNVLCIIGLVGVGVVILNAKVLGVSGEGKIILKTIHVYIGYAFSVNLFWRLIWGFIGNKYVRWNAVLPINKGFWRSLSDYIGGSKSGEKPQYLGHNPLAKIMIAALFIFLIMQATTGLVLAGTDLYMPPFGNIISEWVSASPALVDNIKPGSKDGVDLIAYTQMREFRKPFVTLHYFSFYGLLVLIFLHIGAVVMTEIREKNGLVSAMFTGNKVASKKPVDLD